MYHPKLKTLIPLEDLEAEAQKQIWDNLRHDFLVKMAIMPDCHTGYTLPIGGVALLDEVISPEYVGYDIGCGMVCAILPLSVDKIIDKREKIFKEIYQIIPVGFNSHIIGNPYSTFYSSSRDKNLDNKVNAKLLIQLGTLGSGNHFIEIGENLDGKVSITIHSGSRNIGHSIADFYMKLSREKDSHLPPGFLDINSEYGQAYLQDMNFALQYALDNREHMLRMVLKILNVPMQNFINENHNHAIVCSDGKILHRKGATPADLGQLGVIPGNMRDGVYITRGLGNDVYLSSASHGAGRTMSRKKAKNSISLDDFQKTMKNVTAKVDQGTLDEAPMAYKNLDDVINLQRGIVVDIVDHIKPLINIKG